MNGLLVGAILACALRVCVAYPSSHISDEVPHGRHKRFMESLVTSNAEGILKDFEDGNYKVSFQIKKKEGYHDFCLRIHVDKVASISKFMYGKEKVIKPCIGIAHKTLENDTGLVKYRVRVGGNELYADEIPTDKKMSTCKDVFILGTMCVENFTYKSAKLTKSKSTRNTISFTLVFKDQNIKYDIGGTFDGFTVKEWKCDRGVYNAE